MAVHASGAHGAPEHGESVERVACNLYGLDYVDGPYADARTSDGDAVQIKGCQVWHENGNGKTRGRWVAWREELLHLLADGGMYLLVVYDEDVDPEENPDDFIISIRWVEPEEFGAAIGTDAWHDAHRPSKGKRAKVPWTTVFDREEVEGQ